MCFLTVSCGGKKLDKRCDSKEYPIMFATTGLAQQNPITLDLRIAHFIIVDYLVMVN